MTDLKQQAPKVKVRYSDGGVFELKPGTGVGFLCDQAFIRFMFICAILFLALTQTMGQSQLQFGHQVIVGISLFSIAFLILVVGVGANIFLLVRGLVPVIFTPATLVPMVVILVVVSDYMIMYFAESALPSFKERSTIIAYGIVVVGCLDVLHGRYVVQTHPKFLMDAPQHILELEQLLQSFRQADRILDTTGTRPSRSSAETTLEEVNTELPNTVTISNELIEVETIQYIESKGHHLSIQVGEEMLLLRDKLSKIIEAIDSRLGIQINRSVWVAFASIVKLEDTDKNELWAVMKDGSSFKIANSRKLALKKTLQIYS